MCRCQRFFRSIHHIACYVIVHDTIFFTLPPQTHKHTTLPSPSFSLPRLCIEKQDRAIIEILSSITAQRSGARRQLSHVHALVLVLYITFQSRRRRRRVCE